MLYNLGADYEIRLFKIQQDRNQKRHDRPAGVYSHTENQRPEHTGRDGCRLDDRPFRPAEQCHPLSETVGPNNSIAAIGVAAHETGHAIQFAEGYAPIRVRTAIVPITQFASGVSPWLVFAGMIFSLPYLAYIGVMFFGMAVVFQLITLPVEFNASARAIRALESQGILNSEELEGAKKVLTAAALTYVAALLVALMSFIRLLLIASGRGRRNR